MRRKTDWGPSIYFHDPMKQRLRDYEDIHAMADDFDMYDLSNDLVY
ncbi:MAG: hypothetical protein Q7R76_00385 [Candidatus Woesearchaeota archaeon]|nr:hypothetical protein [Candidatus Woesearchaeota archaeon]